MAKIINRWFNTFKQNFETNKLVYTKTQQALLSCDNSSPSQFFFNTAKIDPRINAFTLDQAVFHHSNDLNLVTNNEILQQQHATYQVAILDAADDYFINYLAAYLNDCVNKSSTQHCDFALDLKYLVPMQCLVFIDQQNQCFLALPIICDLSQVTNQSAHTPVIKTTVKAVNQVLRHFDLYCYGINYFLFWQPATMTQYQMQQMAHNKTEETCSAFHSLIMAIIETGRLDFSALVRTDPKIDLQKIVPAKDVTINAIAPEQADTLMQAGKIIGLLMGKVLVKLKPKYLITRVNTDPKIGGIQLVWHDQSIPLAWKSALASLNRMLNLPLDTIRYEYITTNQKTAYNYNLFMRDQLLAEIIQNLNLVPTGTLQVAPVSTKKAGKPLATTKGLNELLLNQNEQSIFLINKQQQLMLTTYSCDPHQQNFQLNYCLINLLKKEQQNDRK